MKTKDYTQLNQNLAFLRQEALKFNIEIEVVYISKFFIEYILLISRANKKCQRNLQERDTNSLEIIEEINAFINKLEIRHIGLN